MKLHWSPRSPYCRKVMVAAHELSLANEIELVATPVTMATSNAELRSDNPLNKLPTLVVDEGPAIFDSFVIIDYLDELAGSNKLIPRIGASRLRALRLHALGQGLIDLLVLARNEELRPSEIRSKPHMVANLEKRRATVHQLNQEVDDVAAEPFGIAQITVGCALNYWDFRFGSEPWRDDAPQLVGWLSSFDARDSAKRTIFRTT